MPKGSRSSSRRPVCQIVPVFEIRMEYVTLLPAPTRLVVLEVFSSATPSVASMRFVTGFESIQVCCWSARTRATLTACVATGGSSTRTWTVAVSVPPGGRVTFCARTGGAEPAKVAFEPTSVNATLSNQTKSSAPIVAELENRMPTLVET